MDYIEMAHDVAALAATLNHDRINLLGHSMGGKTAMTVALLYPELVDKLIVVDIAPVIYNPKHDQIITALEALPIDRLENRTQASDLLGQDIQDPVLRQFLLQNLIRNEPSGYRWRINLDAIRRNYEKLRSFPSALDNKQFGGPGLFLAGDQSRYVLPEHHGSIAAYFPEAKIVTIDGAGHWVHADKPEALANEVRRFITTE
jgi:esterase